MLPSRAAAEPVAFEIGAGEATDTLKEFARQAKLQTLFDYRLVRNLRTQAVRGDFEADEALRQMLAGTGLRFERINERTVAISSERDRQASAAGQRMKSIHASTLDDHEMRLAQAGTEDSAANTTATVVAPEEGPPSASCGTQTAGRSRL